MYVWLTIEVHSCNYCCSGKSNKYYVLWVCVCSLSCPACYAHALYCHLWSALLFSIFPHYLINGTIFEKYLLNTEHKMCVLISSAVLAWNISHSTKNWSEMWPNIYISLHVKIPVILVRFYWKLNFFALFFRKKYTNIKFHENPSSGNRVVPCGQMDRQTWRSW